MMNTLKWRNKGLLKKEVIHGKRIFGILFACCASFCIYMEALAVFFSQGSYMNALFFAPYNQFFVDFLTCLKTVMMPGGPYAARSMYPAICNIFYSFFSIFVSSEIRNTITQYDTVSIREYRDVMVAATMYTILAVLISYNIIKLLLQGSEKRTVIFTFLLMFSYPMQYCIMNGNSTIIAFIFVSIFIIYNNSADKSMREFALLSLAIAGAWKIYPVVFGLLLLRKKRYMDVCKSAIECLILFVVPFLFYGFNNIKIMISNILNFSNKNGTGRATIDSISWKAAIDIFYSNSQDGSLIARGFVSVILTIFLVVCVLCVKQYWKAVAMCTLLMIGVVPTSNVYTNMFMIISLCLFLNENVKQRIDFVYLILFTLILYPLPLLWRFEPDLSSSYLTRNVSYTTICFCLVGIVFTTLLIVDSFPDVFRFFVVIFGKNKGIVAFISFFICCITASFLGGSYSYQNGTVFTYAGVDEKHFNTTSGHYISLSKGVVLSQSFISERNKITRFKIHFAMEDGDAPINLKIIDRTTGEIIWDEVFETTYFNTTSYSNIYPENEIILDQGKEYILEMQSVCEEGDNVIEVYYSADKSDSPNTTMYINGKEQNANLHGFIYETF